MNDKIRFLNREILNLSKKTSFYVSDNAPSTFAEIMAAGKSLIVWSGASEKTIYEDAKVNYAFRAWHDDMHRKTGLLFLPDHEIELGRLQASLCSSSFLADIVYCDVSLQAEHFKKTGEFIADQVSFAKKNVPML